jgi:Rps23 Pro-64 3,4-dihydroxylase Tpa1-like proline 4-hydroxylase
VTEETHTCLALDQIDEETKASLRTSFKQAAPCKHLVIDDFLTDKGLAAIQSFPDFEWDGWHRFGDVHQRHKATFDNLDTMPAPLKEVLWELNGPRFLRFLEDVTGIPRLISDPFLKGGGLHVSGSGGVLTPHSDFHKYEELRLYRRLNALIYLNPGWEKSDGGNLQFFEDADATIVAKEVTPVLGRCVVFQTDHGSVHGFTDPVGAGKFRRSIATYYYTSEETRDFSGDVMTHWRHRSKQDMSVRDKIKLGASRSLSNTAKALAIAAHKTNPELKHLPDD